MTNSYSTLGRYAGIAMLLTGATASAQAYDKLTVASVSPADGSVVCQLKQVVLQLDGVAEEGVEWQNNLQAPVYDASGTQVTYVTGADSNSGFILRLSSAITEAGTYTIEVPEGAFYTPDWETMEWPLPPVEGTQNDAFTLTYTVEPMDPVVLEYTTPASGSTLTQLNQVSVELSGGDPLFGIEWNSALKATIVNQDGETMEETATIRNMPSGYVMKVSKTITTPGTYTITIPAGALFAINGDMMPVYGTEIKETELVYTVVESEPVEFYSSDPENGSVVALLEYVDTSWTTDVESDVEELFVTNENGETVTTAFLYIEGTDCFLTFEEAIVDNGTYTIVIPQKTLFAFDSEGNRIVDNYNEEVILTYTVENNVGVTSIAEAAKSIRVINGTVSVRGFENPTVEVYDLTGRRVNTASKLLPGLYIIKASDAAASVVERILVK
ncbi:MAG: T9SS type A sorting domain-containing protein [Muribaculaceae bacterium]|nr:T9SS type A sorting domain-containing protein [Muribaculaceae bacterium]